MIVTEEDTELVLSSGIEDDEDLNEKPCTKVENRKSYIQRDSVFMENLIADPDSINDHGIDLEFENYLNEENNLDHLIFDGENGEKFQQELNSKISELELLNFESIEDLRRMAIEKYGFVNKKFRRKAWPILIANRKNYLNSPTLFKHKLGTQIDAQISKFSQISNIN